MPFGVLFFLSSFNFCLGHFFEIFSPNEAFFHRSAEFDLSFVSYRLHPPWCTRLVHPSEVIHVSFLTKVLSHRLHPYLFPICQSVNQFLRQFTLVLSNRLHAPSHPISEVIHVYFLSFLGWSGRACKVFTTFCVRFPFPTYRSFVFSCTCISLPS